MDLAKKTTNTPPKPHKKLDFKYSSKQDIHTLSISGRLGLVRRTLTASAHMDYCRRFEKHFRFHFISTLKRNDTDGLRYLYIGSIAAEIPLPVGGFVSYSSLQFEPSTIYYLLDWGSTQASFLGTTRGKLVFSHERLSVSLTGYYSILATKQYRYIAGGGIGLKVRIEDYFYIVLKNSFSYLDFSNLTLVKNKVFFGTEFVFGKKGR
jgi:hypothetical protein